MVRVLTKQSHSSLSATGFLFTFLFCALTKQGVSLTELKKLAPLRFTPQEVAEYYNTTLVHYQRWWNLRKSLSLHYGIWEPATNTFALVCVPQNK